MHAPFILLKILNANWTQILLCQAQDWVDAFSIFEEELTTGFEKFARLMSRVRFEVFRSFVFLNFVHDIMSVFVQTGILVTNSARI